MTESALLKESFLNRVRIADLDKITAIEVPEEVFRAFVATGTSLSYGNVRVFVEGTMVDTLKAETQTVDDKLFGGTKVK